MKFTREDVGPAANEPPKPPCAACGKPSRASEALYWGKHLCDACEAAWYDYVDRLAKVPDEMGPTLQAWVTERRPVRAVAP